MRRFLSALCALLIAAPAFAATAPAIPPPAPSTPPAIIYPQALARATALNQANASPAVMASPPTITISASYNNGAAAQRAGNQFAQVFVPGTSTINSKYFTYYGIPPVPANKYNASWSATFARQLNNLVFNAGVYTASYEFMYSCAANASGSCSFEAAFFNKDAFSQYSQDVYQIFVDNVPATATGQWYTATAGNNYNVNVGGITPGTHLIRIRTAQPFGGIGYGPNDSIFASPKAAPSALIFCDSYCDGAWTSYTYTNGQTGFGAFEGWATRLCDVLSIKDCWQEVEPGTGVMNTGSLAAPLQFTAPFAVNAVGGNLNAVWTGSTATLFAMFSTGEQRTISVTNGSAAVTWTGGLTQAATNQVTTLATGTLVAFASFTDSTHGVLSATWGGSTCTNCTLVLAEPNGIGETVSATFTNGSANVSWTTPLTGSPWLVATLFTGSSSTTGKGNFLQRAKSLALQYPTFSPAIIVVQGSVNDTVALGYSHAQVQATYTEMLNFVKSTWPNAKVFFTGNLYIRQHNQVTNYPALDTDLQTVAAAFPSIPFYDPYALGLFGGLGAACVPYSGTITFSPTPSNGATSGTLTANWYGTTGTNFTLKFWNGTSYDTKTNVTLTNGSAAVSFPALSQAPSTGVVEYYSGTTANNGPADVGQSCSSSNSGPDIHPTSRGNQLVAQGLAGFIQTWLAANP